jgi:glycosyltransferase involved in cell wall biosynthesis
LPIKGGVNTYAEILFNQLKKIGHNVELINSLSSKKDEVSYLNSSIFKITKAILDSNIFFFIIFKIVNFIIKIKTLNYIKYNEVNVIHCQDINSCNAVFNICKKNNIKLILTIHGHFYNGGTATRAIGKTSWLSKKLLKEEINAYKYADRIICVSDFSYNLVKKYTEERKINIIRNFIDTDKFYPYEEGKKYELRKQLNLNNDEFILIYSGRLIDSKGIKYIIEGISLLVKKYNVKIIIAGEGAEKKSLLSYVNQNMLNDKVIFVGEKNRDELVKYYNIAHVFIMASISDLRGFEGTPMSLLEGMACGLGVVATRSGGIAQVIRDKENAIVIKEKSYISVYNAVEELINNRELLKKISERALEDIKNNFSIKTVVGIILDIYRDQ